jgi:hypothetical protein
VEAVDAFVGGREEGRHGTHLVVYSDSAIGRAARGPIWRNGTFYAG